MYVKHMKVYDEIWGGCDVKACKKGIRVQKRKEVLSCEFVDGRGGASQRGMATVHVIASYVSSGPAGSQQRERRKDSRTEGVRDGRWTLEAGKKRANSKWGR